MRHRRVSGANLKVERFGLPNKPTGTPEQLEELVRCGDWGRAPALPLAPYPAATPQSAVADRSPYTGEPRDNPSGSLREPCGYRGAKGKIQALHEGRAFESVRHAA